MGGKGNSPALVMAAVLLLVLGIADGQLVNTLNLSGKLCCTPTGICQNGSTPLSGVSVQLICSSPAAGGSIVVGRNVTSINGIYTITVQNLLRTIALIIPTLTGSNVPCLVTVPLNQTLCPLLNTPNGILVAPVSLLNVTLSQVFGLIANLAVTIFVFVAL